MFRLKYILNIDVTNVKNVNFGHRIFFSKLASFDEAKNALNTLKEEPDNMTKLKIYALFKQASEGNNTKSKPGMMDFVGKAKWDAWNALKDKSMEAAASDYINLVQNLLDLEKSAPVANVDGGKMYEGLSISNGLTGARTITLNRPNKKNAITWKMYDAWAEALKDAAEDPSVKLVAITGAGDFFSSGNDLSNFTSAAASNDIKAMAQTAKGVLLNFVSAFIDFPKPLIALVNGPAVGIPVTTMALYDYVIAADNATFHTPFTNLGQTPEGCSSYTFSRIMGTMRANRMLLFNHKMTVTEAQVAGFVAEVYPQAEFAQRAAKRVEDLATLPPQTLCLGKALMRSRDKALLHEVNRAECEQLAERWTSDECIKAITSFFASKKK